MKRSIIPLFLGLLALSLPAQDARPPEASLQDLNLGEHWFGPEVSIKDLMGKVILVEIYGS